MVWLIGAIAAFVVAVGTTVMARMSTQATDHTTSVAIENEAVRIATAIDSSARSAHLQADGIAATPMLRAAIVTDAATMTDMVVTEVKFRPTVGEMLEIFQIRDKTKPITMLRLPSTAGAIEPVMGRGTRLENTGKGGLDVVAGSPIIPNDETTGFTGQISLQVPVELGGARQRLTELVVDAQVIGAGEPVGLVDGKGATGVSISFDIQPNAEWGFGPLSLKVMPAKGQERAKWIGPVRYGSLGLGVVLLLLFVIGLRRR
jgi:hypothetical protein